MSWGRVCGALFAAGLCLTAAVVSGCGEEHAPDPQDEIDAGGGRGGCATGSFDHDGSPSTPCVQWQVCAAGRYVVTQPSSTQDRGCADCPYGTFSVSENVNGCTPHDSCVVTGVAVAGTPTSDAVCHATH